MATSAKMPSYRKSIRSRKSKQNLNPREKKPPLTRLISKLPEMPDLRSKESRSGATTRVGKKREHGRRGGSCSSGQSQKPKERLKGPSGSTRPRLKRSR